MLNSQAIAEMKNGKIDRIPVSPVSACSTISRKRQATRFEPLYHIEMFRANGLTCHNLSES